MPVVGDKTRLKISQRKKRLAVKSRVFHRTDSRAQQSQFCGDTNDTIVCGSSVENMQNITGTVNHDVSDCLAG